METETVRDTLNALESAIDFGDLVSQHAPAGHPIFGQLAAARQDADYLLALIPWWGYTGPETPPGAWSMAHGDIDRITEAAATIVNDPNSPLPPTTFAPVRALPWGWIGAGTAGAIGLFVYFYRRAAR